MVGPSRSIGPDEIARLVSNCYPRVSVEEKRETSSGESGFSGPCDLLFTAFEPSGDEHASKVIAEIKRRRPELTICGWGGPKMQKAGALIIERTGDDAVMGMPGIAKIREHQRINERIEEWVKVHPVALHVPVDSPAANFPVCEITKKSGSRVVHLVAPQIWAWGRWRIHKLRRLTDLVLCLLPFEEEFFSKRNVPAKFIGHMLFDEPLNNAELAHLGASFPQGSPRIALMPGSRPAELASNFPLILDIVRTLKSEMPGLVAMVAVTREPVVGVLRSIAREWCQQRGEPVEASGWPLGLSHAVGATDAIIHWSELALVKSGTVTLQVAKHRKPMVIFYRKTNPVAYMLAKMISSTKFFTLPNVIAHKEIVPEFVPYYGGPEPIIQTARELLTKPEEAEAQKQLIDGVLEKFAGQFASGIAADAILGVLDGSRARTQVS